MPVDLILFCVGALITISAVKPNIISQMAIFILIWGSLEHYLQLNTKELKIQSLKGLSWSLNVANLLKFISNLVDWLVSNFICVVRHLYMADSIKDFDNLLHRV